MFVSLLLINFVFALCIRGEKPAERFHCTLDPAEADSPSAGNSEWSALNQNILERFVNMVRNTH